MGPTIIFDKSALQMLSVDESCWLEKFFNSNITPLFYVETLADLAKLPKDINNERTSQDLVKEIADKTPTISCCPNIHHMRLIYNNLIGNNVVMDGRPYVSGGMTKLTKDGKILIDYSEFPEVTAMNRWQNSKFNEVENQFAKQWRNDLANLDFDRRIALVKNILPTGIKINNLESVSSFVNNFLLNEQSNILWLLFELFNFDENFKNYIFLRWQKVKPKNLVEFAPYAAYVLSVDLYFYIAIHFNLISKDRKSNWNDMAYLYYLPFCNIFTSGDKLHIKTVPLFIKPYQTFVNATDLKNGLKFLDEYYDKFSEAEKQQGIMRFAAYPPDEYNLVSDLWDKYLPIWRKQAKEELLKPALSAAEQRVIVEKIKSEKKDSIPVNIKVDSESANSAIFTSHMKIRKGKWRLFPPEVEKNKN